jgi:hypothetical protein
MILYSICFVCATHAKNTVAPALPLPLSLLPQHPTLLLLSLLTYAITYTNIAILLLILLLLLQATNRVAVVAMVARAVVAGTCNCYL